MSKQRIIGFDLARGIAILGMVYVNFKVVMVDQSGGLLYWMMNLLSGKAAALFVVLAGVGMTLMYEGAKRRSGNLHQVRNELLKRAGFLFIIGLSYYFIWPADILHYYGVYMLVAVLLLGSSRLLLQVISITLVLIYPLLLEFIDYEVGWNFSNLEYVDFFSVSGFFRNMFINGFHPVIPWVAFMLSGIWVGRLNFGESKTRNRIGLFAFIIFVLFTGASIVITQWLNSTGISTTAEELVFVATEPMPPLPFYMLSAFGLAVSVISLSVYIGQRFSGNIIVRSLVSTGQLALTNYFFHVIIGMLVIEIVFGELEQAFSGDFVFIYATGFNLILILFSFQWRRKHSRGPLEMLMRKITG